MDKKRNEQLSKIISNKLEKILSKKINEKLYMRFLDIKHTKEKTFSHVIFCTPEDKVISVLIFLINHSYLIYLPLNCSTNDIVDIMNQGNLNKDLNEFEFPIQKKFRFCDITYLV